MPTAAAPGQTLASKQALLIIPHISQYGLHLVGCTLSTDLWYLEEKKSKMLENQIDFFLSNYKHFNSHNSARRLTSGFGDHPQSDIDSKKKGEAGHFISLSESYRVIQNTWSRTAELQNAKDLYLKRTNTVV